MRKLRMALVILGLSMLALVSWVFGIMMAVAQDLPSLESREQYERAENSIVYDVNGVKLATLTNNQGRILLASERDRPGDQGGGGRDRGSALLRPPRGRFPGHGAGAVPGRPLGIGPAGRLDDHPAVRQERARRPGEPHDPAEVPRGGDRLPPRAPVVEGQDPDRVPERDLLRRGRDRDRGRRPHLLRLRAPRLRPGRGRAELRLAAAAVGGGAARGDDLVAERLLASRQPDRLEARAATSCSRT